MRDSEAPTAATSAAAENCRNWGKQALVSAVGSSVGVAGDAWVVVSVAAMGDAAVKPTRRRQTAVSCRAADVYRAVAVGVCVRAAPCDMPVPCAEGRKPVQRAEPCNGHQPQQSTAVKVAASAWKFSNVIGCGCVEAEAPCPQPSSAARTSTARTAVNMEAGGAPRSSKK